MIRKFETSDIAAVMKVWVNSIKLAHDFIDKKYWDNALERVQNNYILNSDSYVYLMENGIVGFISIIEEGNIAAFFVDGDFQNRGVGVGLLNHVKEKYDELAISVYKKNEVGVNFCKNNGFHLAYDQIDMNTDETELFFQWRKNE